MKNIGKKIRYGFTELPKVAILLLVGALIMFPMYMMIAISLMTPAQLEKCPWFPLSIPMPESLTAPRAGELALAPPSLEVQPEGGPRLVISVPADRRFHVHLPDVDMDTSEWTVKPTKGAGGAARPAVVAPDGQNAKALQARLAGVDRVDFLVVVEDLEASLRVEVERPLVPAGRRAIHAEPEQLVEPLLTVAGGGGVTLVAPKIAGVEDAGGQHLPVALDEAPSRAHAVDLGVLGRGTIVVDPYLDLARLVLVAELQEGLALGTDLERAACALAAFRPVDGHVARDCPAGQGLLAVEGPRSGFPCGGWRSNGLLLAPDQARQARDGGRQQTEHACLLQHGLSLSPWGWRRPPR